MIGFDWWRAFSRLRFAHPDAALREIAAHLRHAAMPGAGRTDPHMLLALAEMIDPDETKPATQAKFELRRLKREAPPVEPNYELRRFLEDHIDVLGEPAESVVAAAAAKFGASRGKCFRNLHVMRKGRASMKELERLLAQLRPVGE